MSLAVNHKKIKKLIQHIHRMTVCLEQYRHDRIIPFHTDQFYFMQKETELKLLNELLENAIKKVETINTLIEVQYKEVYCRWQKDVRWLNTYLMHNREDN
jgi:hypothetical protein